MSRTLPPNTRTAGGPAPAADMDDVIDVLALVTNSPAGQDLNPGTWWRDRDGDSTQRICVPLYVYPTYFDPTGDFQTVQAGAPSAGIVILNPDSGPGTSNSDWVNQQIWLHAAGIRAIGYVHTSFSARAIADVEADIDTWYSYYGDPANGGLDGILVDEVDYTAPNQPYYAEIYAYIKAKNQGQCLVVLNPGVIPDESYMACSDIICIHENTYTYYTGSYAASQPVWLPKYAADRYMHVIEDVTTLDELANALALSKTFRAGWVYCIDSAGAYTALVGDATSNPLLWSEQVAWCRRGLAPGPAATQALTGSDTITWGAQYNLYPLSASGDIAGLIITKPDNTVVPPATTAPPSADIRIMLVNTSSHKLTFAASGTSNVADGTLDTIQPNTAATYVWDPAAALWYREAGRGGGTLLAASQFAPSAQQAMTTTSGTFAAVTGAASTVASGSNGGTISAIASWSAPSAGVLAVANGSAFPVSGGTVNVAASGPTTAVVTYTGVSGNTLTGCAYVSGSASGTVSTGGAVTLTSAAASTGAFTAPASGSVLVSVSLVAEVGTVADAVAFGLCAHGTTTPMVGNSVVTKLNATYLPVTFEFLVTALTAGTSYNFDLMFAVTGSVTLTVAAFANTSTTPTLGALTTGAPVVMTVQAV